MLEKATITVEPTLPVRLLCWSVTFPSLIQQTGKRNWTTQLILNHCRAFVQLRLTVTVWQWIWKLFTLIVLNQIFSIWKHCDVLIFVPQAAHWGWVEVHRRGWESSRVGQDRSDNPTTRCGATRRHRAAAVERWKVSVFTVGLFMSRSSLVYAQRTVGT